jgi:hypothetical protein
MRICISRIDLADEAQEEALFRLHDAHFTNLRREKFHQDFREKDWLISARDSTGDYVAFSTIKYYFSTIDYPEPGGRAAIIFSGDTVVRPDYWSANLVARPFAAFLKQAMDGGLGKSDTGLPLYWFLLSKGYRTYMFMPAFFKSYYPGPQADGQEFKPILDRLARERYGDMYDPASGIMSPGDRADALRPELAEVPESRRGGRHVSFFLERNPGYRLGNELCCLTKVERSNIKPAGLGILDFEGFEWLE